MENLIYILGWGTPVGIGLFLFLLAAGGGIFFWGVSQLNKYKDK
jgi:hypothetical protein